MSEDTRLGKTAHSEGVNAYLLERLREHCPYPSGSDERDAWLTGWNQTAHRERRLYSTPLLASRTPA
jgi:ribosome modulation factor